MQFKQHLTYLVAISFLTIIFFLYMSYREINSSIDYEVGTIQSSKIVDSIYIIRDNFSTPIIHTKNIEDFYFSFGQVISSDRLFQLQMLKIFVNGEMSKHFGKDKSVFNNSLVDSNPNFIKNQHLKSDIFIRNLFLDEISDSLLIYLTKENKLKIEKYCEGINYSIDKRKNISSIPFEIMKNIKSEEWKIKDVLKLYSLFSILSNIDFERDIFISQLKECLLKEQFLNIAERFGIFSPSKLKSKRKREKEDNKFYESLYVLNNIEDTFLISDFDYLYFNCFFNHRQVYPFFASKNELYFQYFSSSKSYPSIYYPINFIRNIDSSIDNYSTLNTLTIPGLPFPIGTVFNTDRNSKFLFLAPSDSINYSFRTKNINSIEKQMKTRDIEIEVKNSSKIKLKSLYLEDGFLISPLSESENNTAITNNNPNKFNFIYFPKQDMYNSINHFFALFDNKNKYLDDESIIDEKINKIQIPNLNYFYRFNRNDNFSDVKYRYKKTETYLRNKLNNEKLLNNQLFQSYESSKRFTRLAIGNDFIDKYFVEANNDSTIPVKDNFLSLNKKSSYIYNKITNWNRMNIKESKGSFYFKSFIEKLVENIFFNKFNSYFYKDNNYCFKYFKKNIDYCFDILSDIYFGEKKFILNDNYNNMIEREKVFSKSLAEIDTSFDSNLNYDDFIMFKSNLYSEKFNSILTPLKGKRFKIDGNSFSFKKNRKNILPTFIFSISKEKGKQNRSRYIFAGGISENPLSNYYDDQLSFWKDDIYNDFFDLDIHEIGFEKFFVDKNYLLFVPTNKD